jgi:hypothetical protein
MVISKDQIVSILKEFKKNADYYCRTKMSGNCPDIKDFENQK